MIQVRQFHRNFKIVHRSLCQNESHLILLHVEPHGFDSNLVSQFKNESVTFCKVDDFSLKVLKLYK